MTNYFIVPGLGGSGPEHWQTYFERSGENFRRIEQKDWNAPDIPQWIEAIQKAISAFDPQSVVLVGHSLGCLAIASWAARYNHGIKAALLVAPPDTGLLHSKLQQRLFDHIPTEKIHFRTRLIASTNDHWATIEQVKQYAKKWGSEFITIGDAGHIYDLSGYGDWPEGMRLLKELE